MTGTEAACAEITRRGAGQVVFDAAQRLKASSDWSRMSPVLAEKVPPGRYVADAVVRPATGQDVATILQVAFEHDVPVTPRGAGTGNYGQATPFDGGILLDLRRLADVAIGEDTVTVGAGVRFSAVDKELRAAGRDIWMFPSTKTSTIGGFVGGGSAGTGSIEHGTSSDGFVVSATIAPCDGSGELFTVRGADLAPYIHTYGVTGVLVEVEVRTDPAREWTSVYAAYDSYAGLAGGLAAMADVRPLPRLVSGDEPPLVASLPASIPLDPESFSLRIIAESTSMAQVRDAVAQTGGTIVGELTDYVEGDRLSGMSYNHPVWFFQRARPDETWFHMETSGQVVVDDPAAVRALYDGPVYLHLEQFARGPGGMLVAGYRGEDAVLAGMPRMDAIGLGVHSPHQWYVDRNVELAIETAKRTDPKGLLNRGKLVATPPVDTRVNIGVRS
jgi:hypothetical protein